MSAVEPAPGLFILRRKIYDAFIGETEWDVLMRPSGHGECKKPDGFRFQM
jgi:hypothetical protein